MTTDQIAANRKSAGNLARYQLGLDTIALSDWTYEQRLAFIKLVASYINDNPNAFGEQDLLGAQSVLTSDYTPLEDSSLSITDFVGETASNLVDPLASIGQGVITTVNASKWIIPAASFVLLIILISAFKRKAGA